MEAVYLAPIVETVFLIGGIEILKQLKLNVLQISLISAIFWSVVHSAIEVFWELGVFFLFFFMSLAYQTWSKITPLRGVLMPMSIHALNNLIAVTIILIVR